MRFLWVLVPILSVTVAACGSIRADNLRAGGVRHPEDPAGLVERLVAGNIDQPGSTAYNRWGAGYDDGIRSSDRKFQSPTARR